MKDSCGQVDTSHLWVKGVKGYLSANVLSRLFWADKTKRLYLWWDIYRCRGMWYSSIYVPMCMSDSQFGESRRDKLRKEYKKSGEMSYRSKGHFHVNQYRKWSAIQFFNFLFLYTKSNGQKVHVLTYTASRILYKWLLLLHHLSLSNHSYCW